MEFRDPEKVLVKDAISEAHGGVMAVRDTSEEESKRLWTVLREKMLAELRASAA